MVFYTRHEENYSENRIVNAGANDLHVVILIKQMILACAWDAWKMKILTHTNCIHM